MLWFPHAKINLGLAVLEKRSDGYHSIESLLHPIQLFDLLEICQGRKDKLSLSGLTLDCRTEENLVWKALLLMRKHFEFPPVEIHLHKQIPGGAGLGGGSSDAAHVLLGICQLFHLNTSKKNMMDLALELGSDCPFFLEQKAQYAKGRGELLDSFPLNLRPFKLVLIIPDFSVSTQKAYSKIESKSPRMLPEKALKMPVEKWSQILINDFEEIVFAEFPVLANLKKRLYKIGAVYVSLSGSGSALYALFREKTTIELPESFKHYWMDFPA